jgi:two-component system phosphate regulon sensor histidine kinase PhoR
LITTETFLLLAAAITGAGWWIYLRFIKPFKRIRQDIQSLSEGRFRLPSVDLEASTYKVTASHIRRIAERLRQLDEETVEGGVSLRGILSGMKEGIVIAGRNKKITLANESLQAFFPAGRSPVGRSPLEVFRRHEIEQAVSATLEDGRKRDLELIFDFPQAGGTVLQKHFDIHISPMSREPGEDPQAVLLVFQDVTAIRTLESARREFVANVSHEFRTPLSVINGYVETLQDGATEDAEMTAVSLSAIHRNVQRLSLLLEDLLTISTMEGKGRRLHFSKVDLRRIAERVIENLDSSGAAKRAIFEINWAEDAIYADADENRIEQVYWNLLTNAIRHGETSTLKIRINSRRDGDSVEISIADNGTGIPLEDQAHIFERFYRVHKHRARDAGGTGLGLSIVKNIILAHGGGISLRSTPGDGATFVIRLPFSQGETMAAK